MLLPSGRRLPPLALLAALHATAPAIAQEPSSQATTLDKLTVTAQKREEALQDVPIMLTSLSAQTLREHGVRDLKDLQQLVAGLHVSSTTNEAQTTARIRGVGTNGDNAGLESAVGVVIDGVYRPRVGAGFGDLGEIERIEVLKGPQGTVFGKNASAGVINIVTRRPAYRRSAGGEIAFGNHGERGVSAAYGDALGEAAAFRLYAARRSRDGFLDVDTGDGPRTRGDDTDRDFRSFRARLLVEPSDALDIDLIADYTRRNENCCGAVTTVRGGSADWVDAVAGGAGRGVAAVADPSRRLATLNRGTEQEVADKGVSVQFDWDTGAFGGARLTSISALRDWLSVNAMDYDFTAADLFHRNFDADASSTGFRTFSQELRLTGSSGRLDWMLGAFHAEEDLSRHDHYMLGRDYEAYLSTMLVNLFDARMAAAGLTMDTSDPALFASQATGLAPGQAFPADSEGSRDLHRQEARSTAIFSNNTWHLGERLDVVLGLRYTRERKRVDSTFANPNGGSACAAALADPGSIAQALQDRGVPQANAPAYAQTAIAYFCLPWTNSRHDGRASAQTRDENAWTGTLKFAWRWNEALMTYVSGARGYKGGGFNLDRMQSANGLSTGASGSVPVDDASFAGESVDSYELGAKSTWLGGNLLLNATAFRQRFHDYQLNSFLGTSLVVRSIPQVISRGIDAELQWRTAIDGLSLQLAATYADTRYGKEIPTSEFAAGGALYKLPGSRLSFAAPWSGTLAARYERTLGAKLLGRFSLGARYLSGHNTGSDLDVEKHQPGYTLLDARVGVAARDGRWSVELWGANLGDETYMQVATDSPLQNFSPLPGYPANSFSAFLGPPRSYGLSLRMTY